MPASPDRLRVHVHGILSRTGLDETNKADVLGTWHTADAETAIRALSQSDILVTNAKDKEINLKVIGNLDDQIRGHLTMSI